MFDKSADAPKIAYGHNGVLYVNLTNRCPNACVFCMKTPLAMRYYEHNLDLKGKEPSSQETLDAIRAELKEENYKEIVFCGYGEPTMRLEVLLEVSKALKKEFPQIPLRLNTLGLANAVYGRDITGELCSNIDKISISINSPYKEEWQKVVRPQKKYLENGFESVLDFIKLCAQKTDTTVTVVDKQNIDIEAVKKLAAGLGAKFRLREYVGTKLP